MAGKKFAITWIVTEDLNVPKYTICLMHTPFEVLANIELRLHTLNLGFSLAARKIIKTQYSEKCPYCGQISLFRR